MTAATRLVVGLPHEVWGVYPSRMLKIAVVADYNPNLPSHVATDKALEHAAQSLRTDYSTQWLPTEQLVKDSSRLLEPFDGFFIGPGSPYKSLSGAINAIRFARESGRPLIGTCGGFQHVAIEYARNVLGFADAEHAEYDPNASRLFITALACSLAGRTLLIDVEPTSLAWRIYGRQRIQERYHCNFGLSAAYRSLLENAGVRTTGVEAGEEQSRGESRILELPGHPFFIATLFVPQMRSTTETPHPLVGAFLRAAANS
jgi:CTP synthase (UTP-ammonia lyase)